MLTGAAEQVDGKSTNDASIFCSLYHPERTETARLITHHCRARFRNFVSL